MDVAHSLYSGVPETLDEAVEYLDRVLHASYKRVVAETAADDLMDYHFGLGVMIRSAFKLREGNSALLSSCEASGPDDASTVIIEALWHRLQGEKLSL